MQAITQSSLTVTLREIVSDASGLPVSLIRAKHQFDADLGLSFDQIEDLRSAVEFEFSVGIRPSDWLKNCDCIETIRTFLVEIREAGEIAAAGAPLHLVA